MTSVPSALHVNDAAFTAARIVHRAKHLGYAWELMPRAFRDPSWSGPVGEARRALTGLAWAGRLAVEARSHDVVHIHSATTLRHTRPVVRRFVLHCHGSDVRSALYEPGRGPAIRAGLVDAEAVFYSTPDLAEHVLPHRPDAVLLPVPVDVDQLPGWRPDPTRPQVLFASRWEPVKGMQEQLVTARLLVEALGERAEVIGLDWGPGATDAAAVGVRLVPRVTHDEYVQMLARATVVVGQAAGILSSSELEALGCGAPLVVPGRLLATAGEPPPTQGHDPVSAVDAATQIIRDPGAHSPEPGRTWTRRHHGVDQAVATLADTYRRVVAAR